MTNSDSWTPFDIDHPGSAPPLRPGEDEHVVAFLAAPAARAAGWSRRAAVELCRQWAAEGLRVVLCDVALEDPELHEVVGLYNHEGVTDALLFGSSFQRIGQHLSDGLLLATAGTAVPDGEALRAHPRWRDFAQAFTEAGAVLVLYLPWEAPGADALLDLCDTAVVLGDADEVDGVPLPAGLARLGAVGPPRTGATATAGTAEDAVVRESPEESDGFVAPWEMGTEEEDARTGADVTAVDGEDIFALELETVAPLEESAATLQEAEDHLETSPGHSPPSDAHPAGVTDDAEGPGADAPDDPLRAPGVPLPVEPSAGAPPPRERLREPRRPPPSRKKGGGRTILLVLLAVVLVLVLLGLAGIIRIPGLGFQSADAEPSDSGAVASMSADAAPAPDAGSATDGVVPAEVESPVVAVALADEAPLAALVLSVGSYRQFADARARASALNATLPGVHFFVAAVEVDGLDWYRVLAGSAPDRPELDALRARLADALGEPEGWLVRQGGLSYLLDETPDLSAARSRVATLADRGVPAHVLRLPAQGGGVVYRVYAGAYADQEEARYLGSLLRDLDPALRDAPLTERRGIRPE